MKIGFVGLGTMGRHMAGHLQAAGHEMTVYDLRAEAVAPFVERGATAAASPAELAAASEVVFTSLPGPPEVRRVAGELAQGFRPDTVWADLTTNSPTVVRELHASLAARSVHVLDAPVSGGPKGAETGKLAIWVGGDEAIFDRVKPVFEDFSDQPAYIGPIGAGSVAKLVHNCAGYMVQTAMAEVFTMGVKAGVEPVALWKAVRQGAIGRRRTFDGVTDQFLPGTYDPAAFALRLAHKDVSLATELGREMGVPMRLANLTLEELTEAMARGWSERDSRVAMLLQEERAGLEIAEPVEAIKAVYKEDGR